MRGKLYQTIRCMSCRYVFRTPVYCSHSAHRNGFDVHNKRKESDPCPKCKAKTVIE